MQKKTWGSGIIFYGILHLRQAPWFLVLIKDRPIWKEERSSIQRTLLITFLCCFFIGLFVIFQLIAFLTSRIRESDSKRMSLIREATHSHRLATISSEQIEEEHIQVTVRDSGTGMDSQTLKHIFGPFFTTKVTGEGYWPWPFHYLGPDQTTWL